MLSRVGTGGTVVGRGAGHRAACWGVVGCWQGFEDVGFVDGADACDGVEGECAAEVAAGCVADGTVVVAAVLAAAVGAEAADEVAVGRSGEAEV
jgi:hypothetical protein